MIKKIALILTLIVILFTLTGCYSNVDMDKYFYIVGLALDTSENGLIKVSIQIANTLVSGSSNNGGNSGNSDSGLYRIYSVESETIDSAITTLNNYLNKKINLSHCTILVISEELCKQRNKRIYINFS